MFTGLPGTRGCSRVLTVYGIETSEKLISSLHAALAAAVGYLPFTVLKPATLFQRPRHYRLAAVGYLPFTVLKPVSEYAKGAGWSCCSRVLTVYGIET